MWPVLSLNPTRRLRRRNARLRHLTAYARPQAPLRRLRRRPRLPLRLHPGVVAALARPERRGRRADGRAVSRAPDRDALLAERPEPHLPRGRVLRTRPRPRREAARQRPP